MRLRTNNLAIALVGFAAWVLIAPILVALIYLLGVWKARRSEPPLREAPSSLRNLFETLCHIRLL